MDNKKIDSVLEEMIAEYERKALAYMLHFESGERRLSQQIRKDLQEKYGKESFSPKMEWEKHFGDLADSEKLDERINALLKKQNYDKEAFVASRDRLKNKLWNEARHKAHKILDEISTHE